MSQIFLYTKGAKIGNETRKMLKEQGYIPVEVSDLSDVRVVSSEGVELPRSALMWSAAEAMLNPGGGYTSDVRHKFGQNIAQLLRKQFQPSKDSAS